MLNDVAAQERFRLAQSRAEGMVRPIVHGTMSLDEVARAHALMESGEHSGKILLTV